MTKPPRDSHILITGSNRSGTTWVGEILRRTGQVNYVYEPFGRRFDTLKVECPLQHHFHYVTDDEADAVKRYLDCCMSSYNISWRKELKKNRTTGALLRSQMRQAKALFLAPTKRRRSLLKDPLALMSAGWIYETYNCHVVVMIRHPAAYVQSIKRMGWRADPTLFTEQNELMHDYLEPFDAELRNFQQRDDNIVEEAILRWRIYHHVIERFRDRYPNWIFERHEDLSNAPSARFEAMCKRLDLNFSEAVQSEINRTTRSDDKFVTNKSVHVLRRNSKANVKRWKELLSASEIDTIKSRTRDIWAKFYDESEW